MKQSAKASQQNYSDLLKDRIWEQFDIKNEKNLLWDKIAFVICGFQKEYNKKDKEIIEEILEKCLKYGKKAILFTLHL